MTENHSYTTQLQAGLGMMNETLDLLRSIQPGDTPTKLADRIVSGGLFARTTARRTRNIVAEMFAPRFLVRGDEPARTLATLIGSGGSTDDMRQIFFLQTARAQTVFGDFVKYVYWPRYAAGALVINRAEAETFIRRALDEGRMQKRWTETTIQRVSGYILGCCSDFGLLEKAGRSSKKIQRFTIRPKVALYLAYDLHFSGLSDKAIIGHSDWKLFGMEPQEALDQIKRMSHDGHLLVQSSADLTQISWKYRSMEEAARAIS
jgi:hypothetical protein